MKKKNILLPLVTVLFLMICLAGCGKNNETVTQDTQAQESESGIDLDNYDLEVSPNVQNITLLTGGTLILQELKAGPYAYEDDPQDVDVVDDEREVDNIYTVNADSLTFTVESGTDDSGYEEGNISIDGYSITFLSAGEYTVTLTVTGNDQETSVQIGVFVVDEPGEYQFPFIFTDGNGYTKTILTTVTVGKQ